MDRKFILIPAIAAGIFLARFAQQRAEALTAPTATIGQTPNPMTTLVHRGDRGGYGYGGGWGRTVTGATGVGMAMAVTGVVAVGADMAAGEAIVAGADMAAVGAVVVGMGMGEGGGERGAVWGALARLHG